MTGTMATKGFKRGLTVVGVIFVIVLIVGGYCYKQISDYPDEKNPGDGSVVTVTIPSGASFPQIAKLLKDAGVIARPKWFQYYAMNEGATTKVRSGTYQIKNNLTPEQVLKQLLAGVPERTVNVTIPEGLHMLEIFKILEEAGVARADALEKLARSRDFLHQYAISGPTVDGHLFPDTYRFRLQDSPKKVLNRLIVRHRAVWSQVYKENRKSAERLKKRLKWDDFQLLTLASIVEKEAVVAPERPRIAQVFINRLVSPRFVPHRLDTDPTIRYGCMVPEKKSKACQIWDPTQRLRRKQLDDVDNPYNTYQHEGLPPGPICNPGRDAMRAAMDPDGSNYLFFVSRNNGTHVFSKTRAEHERAVDKFQR